jgi:hypothetical protein
VIDLGFPASTLVRAADMVYGGTLDSIEDARTRIPIEIPAPVSS